MGKKIGILIMAVILALAGCGTKAEKTEIAAKVQQKEMKEELILSYYWETEKHQKSLEQLIQKYNESQDKYFLTTKYIPYADFNKNLSISIAGNDSPDLVIIDIADFASYASMGVFEDLTGKLDTGEYYENAMESCTMNGGIYGIPFGCNCLAFFYNETLLKDAQIEVPKTWEELERAAARLSGNKVCGLAFSGVQYEEGTFNYLPWLWSAGADYDTIDSKEGIRALEFIRDLTISGGLSKEIINWTQGDVMNQFASGNVAMMINGSWQIPTMREMNLDFDWNVAAIPKDRLEVSGYGGENFAVLKGNHVEGAVDFLEFATSKEQVGQYIDDFGYLAARRDVADQQYREDGVMRVFTEQMKYARVRGPHPKWPEISDAISGAFNKAIIEEGAVSAIAWEAQIIINEYLKD